jgi:murein DD-endopeptidase MepM/ murein hydrolase activator NlpD
MSIVNNSIIRSNLNLNSISGSIGATRRSISDANNSVDRISKNILYNTRTRQELFNRSMILQSRRIEASKRQEVEDQVESSKVSIDPKRGLLFSSKSEQGPFGRLMSFLGFITAGWMVENLPTWTFMGKEFISRIYKFGNYVPMMIQDFMYTIKDFGGILSKGLSAIVRLDFKEFSEGSVKDSFDDLKVSIENLGNDITSAFGLFKEPLTTSLDTGEQAPGLGDIRPDSIPGTTTTSGVTGIHKQALDIISKYESAFTQIGFNDRGYNAMNQGGEGMSGIYGSGNSQSKRLLNKPLTSMTVSEIMDRQNKNKNYSGPNSVGIFAAGRYQIIPDTLKDMVNKGIISKSDIFNEQTQDKAGLYLIKTRGIQPWGWDSASKARFSSSEQSIIERARREPVSFTNAPQTPLITNFAPVSGTSGNSMGNVPVSFPYSPLKPGSDGVITSIMGMRGGRPHTGYDIAAKTGTPLYAYLPGRVTHVNATDEYGKGYGYWVIWKDDVYGSYHFFGHLQKPPSVSVGQAIKQGALVGYVGSTGRSTGPHLHWEISNQAPDAIGNFTSRVNIGDWLRSHPLKKIDGSQAQITPPPKPQPPQPPSQQSTQNVVIIDDSTSTPPPMIQSAPSQQSYTPTISEFKLLNNFIKNKLLLDLAYL